MQVSKGLGTYAGLITALAQYLGAIALFLEASDQALALGPLATATATLITVIAGRMWQAKPTPMQRLGQQAAAMGLATSASSTAGNVTWTTPRPGVEVSNLADRDPRRKAAVEENTAALKAQTDALKRQADLAAGLQSTSSYQLTKYLADIIDGHIVGRGAAGRAFSDTEKTKPGEFDREPKAPPADELRELPDCA